MIQEQWTIPVFNTSCGKWEFRVLDGAGNDIRTERFDSEDEARKAHKKGFIDRVLSPTTAPSEERSV